MRRGELLTSFWWRRRQDKKQQQTGTETSIASIFIFFVE
jgi:hypothetical protein